MFSINAKPTFEATVKVPVPGEKPADLKLIFKHKTREATEAYFATAKDSKATDGEFLDEIVAGWTNVDAEYSTDAMTKLCQNYHGAVQAIFDTYLLELNKARAKN